MAKFAPVCSAQVLKQIKEQAPELFGDYFLLLAHDILANADGYREQFPVDHEYTVIVDNSVIELGKACTAENLFEAACIVNATAVAIPDVLEDGKATFLEADHFLKEWEAIDRYGVFKLMYIPQGRDLPDYLTCYEVGARKFGVFFEWVGIPRNTTGRIIESRSHLVGFHKALTPNKKIHLLGFSSNIEDDIFSARMPGVEGIDSAVPLRMRKCATRCWPFEDPGPRGDWWEAAEVTDVLLHNLRYARDLVSGYSVDYGWKVW